MASGLRELRRAQVVKVARRIIASDGLEAMTIASLEEALDFSRGVITYHFEDKNEILEAVLSGAVQEIDSELREIPSDISPEEQLRQILGVGVKGFIARPDAVKVLFAFWGRMSGNPKILATNQRLYRSYRAQARRFLEHNADAINPVSITGMAGLMVSAVIGIAAQAHFDPGDFDPQAALDEACASVAGRLFGERSG